MKKSIKKIVVFVILFFLLMQFYQPARNIHYGQVLPADFIKTYDAPKDVEQILRSSCYDCHSNNTNYPWYSYIQPARFFMENHIKEGKENLNFSEWGNYGNRKQRSKLEAIVKQIEKDEMPLSSYIVLHNNAKLSSKQKREVINWINKISN